MESYRGVTLASRNLNRAKFGTQISEEQRLNGTFESKAWPGSRKSRLQQSLKKDCDYLKQITTEFRTGEYRPSSGTSTNYTGSKTPNTASPYKIRKSSISYDRSTRPHTAKKHNICDSWYSTNPIRETVNRSATNEIKRMHNLTNNYETRDFDLNMDIGEMYCLMEEKQEMYWKLIKDINDASFHYKGIQDTNLCIEKFSESAYNSKKNQENVRQKNYKNTEEISKLLEQKDNLQELIAKEKDQIYELKDMCAESKHEERNIKKTRDLGDKERRFLKNNRVAMEVRTKNACKYEEYLENNCGIRKNLNTRLHKYIDY